MVSRIFRFLFCHRLKYFYSMRTLPAIMVKFNTADVILGKVLRELINLAHCLILCTYVLGLEPDRLLFLFWACGKTSQPMQCCFEAFDRSGGPIEV